MCYVNGTPSTERHSCFVLIMVLQIKITIEIPSLTIARIRLPPRIEKVRDELPHWLPLVWQVSHQRRLRNPLCLGHEMCKKGIHLALKPGQMSPAVAPQKELVVSKRSNIYILFIIFQKFSPFGQFCNVYNERNFLENATQRPKISSQCLPV